MQSNKIYSTKQEIVPLCTWEGIPSKTFVQVRKIKNQIEIYHAKQWDLRSIQIVQKQS